MAQLGIIRQTAGLLQVDVQEGGDTHTLTFSPADLDRMSEATAQVVVKVTEAQLKAIAPLGPKNIGAFIPHLNAAMTKYGIDTPKRIAAFLAQLAHESDSFRYTREIWGPTDAQRRYEGRKDLGNVVTGDGSKYRGRGLVQITGRANYAAAGKALGVDLITHPGLLETPQYAALSAAWFWQSKGLNELADQDKYVTITRKINGGENGIASRLEFWARAKKVFKVLAA